jgi:glycosyltransferase involved in cell wall biosynthesis
MVSVTIAVTTYNGERYLAEQLDSLLRQTWTDFEILVSDDDSRDGTGEILERYAAADPRIRIVRNRPGLGLQRNFEAAFKAARGQLIAPCDQDDIWEDDKLATLVERLRASGAVMAYCDSALVDATNRPMGKRAFELMTAIDGGAPLQFAFSNCISGHAMLFDRRVLDVALPFPDAPIYDWWLAAAATSIGTIVRVDRPLVRYRQHDTNLTDMAGRRGKAKGPSAIPRWLKRDREVAARLAAMARLPGPTGAAYGALADLWQARMTRRFAPGLAVFVWRHRRALFAIKPGSVLRDVQRAAKFVIGRAWRRPQDYPATP